MPYPSVLGIWNQDGWGEGKVTIVMGTPAARVKSSPTDCLQEVEMSKIQYACNISFKLKEAKCLVA